MHKSHKLLIDELSEARKKVAVGKLYFHYKNPELSYRVIKLAIMEADDSLCVIYEAQYGDNLVFVRPLTSWLEKVKWNDKEVNRFTKIDGKQD